jgi:hypothetical protein
MVRNLFIILIATILVNSGCKRPNYVIQKENQYIIYWNFKETKSFRMPMDSTPENLVSGLYIPTKIKLKHRLNKKLQNQILEIYYEAANMHFKEIAKDEYKYLEVKYDESSSNKKLYFIGNYIFISGIKSYMFLETDSITDMKTSNRTIILFNIKQNKLISIVQLASLSHGIDDSSESTAYWDNDLFTQKMEYYPTFLLSKLYEDLNIDTEETKFIRITQFKINNDGCVIPF